MADLSELHSALIAADKAGDTEAAKALAVEINRVQGIDEQTAKPKTKPLKIGAEGLPDAVRVVAGDFHPATQLAVGSKAGWDLAAMRLKQLASSLTPQDEMEVKANRALLDEMPMAKLGAVGTEVAAAGGPFAAGYRGLTSLAAKAVPEWLAKTGAAGILGAGQAAATQPVLQGESTMQNAKEGGIGAMIGDAALRGVGRLAQPVLQIPAVKKLLSQDIVPTIGQAMDESTVTGRMAKGVEEKLQSVPFIGDVIKNARRRAVEEFNSAMIQKAAPGVTEIGREGINKAEQAIGAKYDSALSQFTNGVKPDLSFVTAAHDIPKDASLLLGGEQKRHFNNFVQDKIIGQAKNGSIDAEVAKKIDSEIGAKARDLQSSSIASERDLGKAFRNLQEEFRSMFDRSAPTPEASALLASANQDWANFVRVQKAAGSLGAKDGVFTPAQFQNAVKAMDTSVRKGRFAKGTALGQDISDPAKSVLGDTIPNSGSIDRLLTAEVLLGGGAGGAAMLGHPLGAAAVGGAMLSPALYSRAGQRYMLGDLIPGQEAVGGALREIAPYGASAGGILKRTQWMGSDSGANK